ncbi:hypothetical protein Rhe02_35000 [Rhizocola hellebori]|uniref:2-oxo-4-hydroxy-4-carboxy-5-ureidoimidazoline decarboxylase n=1 Tax=Rhizocola hellebori TaxID=1392758 RepID=A0A8J3Q7C1_9ACTN|nr:hypothetical protein Rhe02_35000 [Rhizocola hellebori]
MERFHSLSHEEAVAELMTCCAVRSWAVQMSGLRPFPDETAFAATGRKLAEQLSWPEVLQALSAHPRIGQRVAAPDAANAPDTAPAPEAAHASETARAKEAQWSRQEQAGVSDSSQEALVAGNIAYERRFGHIYLICATGLSGEQMLAELTRRLENDAAQEQAEVRRELAKIVELRLRKLVAA